MITIPHEMRALTAPHNSAGPLPVEDAAPPSPDGAACTADYVSSLTCAAGVLAPAAAFSRVVAVRRCFACNNEFIPRDQHRRATCPGCRAKRA